MPDWDAGSWCVCFTTSLGVLLFVVGVFVDGANDTAPVGDFIFLAACALWIFLIFCGWAFKPAALSNPCLDIYACIGCCLISSIVFGITILFILETLSKYKEANKVNFDASNATLTRFYFTSSNNSSILSYNLSVDVTVGPNKKNTGVYYSEIQAWAFYQGQNFTSLSMPPFYVGGKKNHSYNSTVVLHPVFQGQQAVVLTADGLRRYKKETAARRYSIDVTLSYVGIRTNDYNNNMTATGSNDTLNKADNQVKGVVTFGLKVPLSSDVTNGIALAPSGATKSFEYKMRDGLIQLVVVAGFLFTTQFVF